MSIRRQALEQLCKKYYISTLYSFGSRLEAVREWMDQKRPEFVPSQSDIDIGVKASPGRTFSIDEKVKLAEELEKLFGSGPVELVFLSEADPFLAAEIIRGERFFAQNEHEADEYDLYVLRRAGDLAPLERERMAIVLGEPL
jgi:predicted nucleotidyltransferase